MAGLESDRRAVFESERRDRWMDGGNSEIKMTTKPGNEENYYRANPEAWSCAVSHQPLSK